MRANFRARGRMPGIMCIDSPVKPFFRLPLPVSRGIGMVWPDENEIDIADRQAVQWRRCPDGSSPITGDTVREFALGSRHGMPYSWQLNVADTNVERDWLR